MENTSCRRTSRISQPPHAYIVFEAYSHATTPSFCTVNADIFPSYLGYLDATERDDPELIIGIFLVFKGIPRVEIHSHARF